MSESIKEKIENEAKNLLNTYLQRGEDLKVKERTKIPCQVMINQDP